MFSLKLVSLFVKPNVRGLKKSAMAAIALDLPPKPKKPVTPWIAFVRDRKDEVLRQGTKMCAPELSTILSKEWKSFDRTQYEEQYNKLRLEYKRQVEDYENALNPKHREYLKLKGQLRIKAKANRELRKTNPPRLPRSASNFFIHERCKDPDVKVRMKSTKMSKILSELFEEYRTLSEEDKEKVIAMQNEDKLRFQNEFMSWYNNVQNDVVNKELSKAAREQVNLIYTRYKSLGYI